MHSLAISASNRALLIVEFASAHCSTDLAVVECNSKFEAMGKIN